MFGRRIPTTSLAGLCRQLSVMLRSGVNVVQALSSLAKRFPHLGTRDRLGLVLRDVKQGSDLTEGFAARDGFFPQLFLDMLRVGEQSGSVPEVLAGMSDHYENLVRLRRAFLSAIAWPAIQLFAAIFIVAFVIYILGVIGESNRRAGLEAIDMLGLGLSGWTGALLWLAGSLGTIAFFVGGYFVLHEFFQQQRLLDSLLQQIPVVGTCLRSFAIARFSWAFALTQQAGMDIEASLKASLAATNNGAFTALAVSMVRDVRNGSELSEALAGALLFPGDFVQMVQVAEQSGTVPEMLARMSPEFEAEARRAMSALTMALGWLVWLAVAGLVIFIIFSVMLNYIKMINSLL